MNVKQIRTVLCNSILCSLVLLLAATFAAPSGAAQSTGGRIRGTVTDATGGAVVGAKVTIINQATGSQRDTEAGTNGEYIFLEVPVGTYEVQFNHPGFKKNGGKGIVLNLNEVLGVDSPLGGGGSKKVGREKGTAPAVGDA